MAMIMTMRQKTVEIAKPAMPKAGIKNNPKIKIGLSIMLKITPNIRTFL